MTAESPPRSPSLRPSAVLRAALPLAVLLALAALAWRLADVLLLGFAAILFAIVLRGLAGIIERRTPAKAPWSLVLAGLLIALALGGFASILGPYRISVICVVRNQVERQALDVGGRHQVRQFEQAAAAAPAVLAPEPIHRRMVVHAGVERHLAFPAAGASDEGLIASHGEVCDRAERLTRRRLPERQLETAAVVLAPIAAGHPQRVE